MKPCIFFKNTQRISSFLPSYCGACGREWPAPDILDESLWQKIFELENGTDSLVEGERFINDLRQLGHHEVELLAVGEPERVGWKFLGFDICEMPNYNWSSIEMMASYLDKGLFSTWKDKLNRNGLLSLRSEAEELLELYLNSPDADRGYHGSPDDGIPDESYAICAIWRFSLENLG